MFRAALDVVPAPQRNHDQPFLPARHDPRVCESATVPYADIFTGESLNRHVAFRLLENSRARVYTALHGRIFAVALGERGGLLVFGVEVEAEEAARDRARGGALAHGLEAGLAQPRVQLAVGRGVAAQEVFRLRLFESRQKRGAARAD